MAATSVPDSTVTQVLAPGVTAAPLNQPIGHAVWFQNTDTANGFWIQPVTSDITQTLSATGFWLGPATSATVFNSLIIQSSGGDTTLVRAAWQAFQTSGGTLTSLTCGRW